MIILQNKYIYFTKKYIFFLLGTMNDSQVKRLERYYLLHPDTFHEHKKENKEFTDKFLKNLKKNNPTDYYNFLKKI